MDRRTKLEINMFNAQEVTFEEYEESIIVKLMKRLLYTLSTDERDHMENSDELEEAARVMIEYYGIPHKDFTYE
jgi:transposase-like protein